MSQETLALLIRRFKDKKVMVRIFGQNGQKTATGVCVDVSEVRGKEGLSFCITVNHLFPKPFVFTAETYTRHSVTGFFPEGCCEMHVFKF